MDQKLGRGTTRKAVRRLLVAVAVLLLSASFGAVALAHDNGSDRGQTGAATTTLTINYTCVAGCSGTFTHSYAITLDCEGDFTGTGSFSGDPTVTEQISGRMSGDRDTAVMRLQFVTRYTGTNAGYSVEVRGSIDPTTGAIGGDAISSTDQTFTVTGTRGDVTTTGSCGEDDEDDD